MENGIKLVIFDLDGTLVNLPIDYDRLKMEFARILGTDEISPISKTLSRIDEKTRGKIFEVWTSLELEALPKLELIGEGIELYNKFSNKIRCLVTLQGRRIVEKILERIGLSFDFIVTRENGLFRDEQIRMVLQKFGVNPESVLMIGDRESDKEAAEKVGCKFIFVK